MKIDIMRKIDLWCGIPLTFFLSILYKVKHLFFKTKFTERPKNILFIELSEMGSTVIADPAMQKAKKQFQANLFFLIFSKNKISLSLLKTVPNENICVIRENNLFVFVCDVLSFFIWARRKKIDTIIDLELFSRATALLSGLSGAKYRVGFCAFHNEGLYRGSFLTHNVVYNPHQHMVKNFMALVYALESNNNEVPYTKRQIDDKDIVLQKAIVSEESKAIVLTKIQKVCPSFQKHQNRLVLINPNASDLLPQRIWPQDHFKALIQNILATYPDIFVLITGAPRERNGAQILCNKVSDPRCLNFAGNVEFLELLPLYELSSLMVTNDSGPGHFSAVTLLQTIVLFGPETSALYGSLGNSTPISLNLACSPCVSAANHRKTACSDNVCLKQMQPSKVMKEIKRILN